MFHQYYHFQFLLSIPIVAIAKFLLKKKWSELKKDLHREYYLIKINHDFNPPLLLQKILISGEDHRYFYHPGFDVIAICRAIWRRIAWGVQEGASTIEQQIVRLLTNQYERTLRRKIQEILLATLVSRELPKDAIPTIYLKIAYFGWRMNGLQQACKRLGLDLNSMSIKESASLIARLKYPEPKLSPAKRTSQILRRQNYLTEKYRKHCLKQLFVPLESGDAYESI